MRAAVVLLLVALAGCTPDQRGQPRTSDGGATSSDGVPLSQLGFSEHARRRLAAAHPAAEVRIRRPLELEVRPAGAGAAMDINLHRVWNYCLQGAPDCAAAVDRFAGGLAESMDREKGLPQTADLRAVVRSDDVVAEVRAISARSGSELLAEPLVDSLWVVLVEDRARTVRYVTTKDLDGMRLSREAVFAQARTNTRNLLGPLSSDFGALDRKGIGMIRGGFFLSSRILFVEDWRRLAEFFDGSLVIAMPEPGSVLFARGDNPQIVAELERAASEVMRVAERPLSATVLRWSPEGWQSTDSRPRGAATPRRG